MDDQQINKAKTVVIGGANKIKSLSAGLPAGLIVGFGAGFLLKGLKGGIIGAIAGVVIVQVYQNSQNK